MARHAAMVTLASALLAPVARAQTPEIRIFGSNDEILAEMGVDFD